ncbi:MAG: hypothetical protein WAM91_17875 [Candidatus Acidiferrales bacterium]
MQTPGFNQPETNQPEPIHQEIIQQELIYAHAEEPGEIASYEPAPASSPRRRSWTKWLWLAAGAFLIFQFYYVQEMLAILVIFAGIFIIFAIIAGIVYAVGRAGESTITAAEPVARRGMELAEEVSKKTFRRPRSAPAP